MKKCKAKPKDTLKHYQSVLLLAIAERCVTGMTTVKDAEALKCIARSMDPESVDDQP